MANNNETVQLKITDMSDMGQGIGRIDNVVVFVDGALPGDTVNAQIYERKKKYYKAKVVDIIQASPDRAEPKCPHSEICGGCSYMSMDYEAQLLIKANHLIEKLRRIAEVDDYELEPIIGMDNPYNYRNKTEFAVNKDGVVGFNKAGTNKVVDIPQCFIASPVANIILPIVKSYFKGNPRRVNKVTVRTSFSTGETMIIFQGKGPNPNSLIPLVEEIDDRISSLYDESAKPDDSSLPSLESVYIHDETKKNNAYTLIAGKRTIEDEILGLRFEISPASFYQTNPIQTKNLFAKVREYSLSETDVSVNTSINGKRVFDLYCGVGSIGLTLANSVKEVVGIEVVKDAIIDANRNAVINGIVNARYLTGKAEDKINELIASDNNDTIVLLDPPRAGCKREVLDAIGSNKALGGEDSHNNNKIRSIIYVSCDPATFARDIKILKEFGFSLKKIIPIDMFPHTNHLEVVGLIQR